MHCIQMHRTGCQHWTSKVSCKGCSAVGTSIDGILCNAAELCMHAPVSKCDSSSYQWHSVSTASLWPYSGSHSYGATNSLWRCCFMAWFCSWSVCCVSIVLSSTAVPIVIPSFPFSFYYCPPKCLSSHALIVSLLNSPAHLRLPSSFLPLPLHLLR